MSKKQKWLSHSVSQWVSQWQGHLLSCQVTANNSDDNDENNKVGLTLLGLILSSSLIVGLILLARCNFHKMISTSFFCLLSPLLSSLPERMQPVKITNMFQDVQKEMKYWTIWITLDSNIRYLTRTRGDYYTQVIEVCLLMVSSGGRGLSGRWGRWHSGASK